MRFFAGLRFQFRAMIVGAWFVAVCSAADEKPSQPVQIKTPVRVRLTDGLRPLTKPATPPTPPDIGAKGKSTPPPGSPVSKPNPPAASSRRTSPDKSSAPEKKTDSPPASDAKPAVDLAPRAASFQGITPGVTKADEVQTLLGKPAAKAGAKNEAQWTYKVGPFPKVEITLVADVVHAIVIHLQAPAAPADVARDLDLAVFEPVPVPDETGEILGQAYPERGILLAFAPGAADRQVAHIALEQISAESFLLRAQHFAPPHVTRGLADLDVAQRINPHDPRPHRMRARLLASLGKQTEALAAAHEAVRLDPDNADYRLTQARRLADTGQFVRAIKDTRAIVDQPKLRPDLRAAAECQLGELLATGPSSDYAQAVEHHLAAIKTATTLAQDRHPGVRRAAKQILLAAHLGVAQEIAAGNWQRKPDVVAQWLLNADRIARDLVDNEGAPELVRFAAQCQALAAAVALPPGLDFTSTANETIELGRRLIAQATDPLFKQQLEWELGEAHFAAMRVAQNIGKQDDALKLGGDAIALLESAAAGREATSAVNQLFGRAYFAVGAIHAVARNDHAEAVRWFDKALPRFAEQPAEAPLADLGEHGERLVSMGVSYWQADQREQGMKLTKQGAQLIQRAVKNGTASELALAVPYGNLASMHEELGNKDEAQSFQSLAAKIESPDKTSKQR